MRLGVLASFVFHLALLGWALIAIHSVQDRRVPDEPTVAVDIVSVSELTRLKQGAESAKELETKAKESPVVTPAPKEAPKPTPTAAAPPPPTAAPPPEPAKPTEDEIAKKLAAMPPEPVKPAPPPEPVVAPGPTPDEKKVLEEKLAEEQRKAEELRKQQELERQKRIAKQKELAKQKAIAEAKKAKDLEKQRQASFDPNAICKTLGTCESDAQKANISKEKPKGAPAAASKSEVPAKATGPSKGVTDGRDNQLSATERDLLTGIIKTRLRECWHLPAAGGGTQTPVVTLKWRLRLDGSLDGEPQVVAPRGDPAFQLAAEAALRAVRACSPFDQLPPDKYKNWSAITWDFDPSQQL